MFKYELNAWEVILEAINRLYPKLRCQNQLFGNIAVSKRIAV